MCPPTRTNCHTQLFSFRSNPLVEPIIALQRREIISHLRARRWQKSINEKVLQPLVRKYGSAAQRLFPQLVNVHLFRHIRALTEGGDITDRFGNNFVRRVRA